MRAMSETRCRWNTANFAGMAKQTTLPTAHAIYPAPKSATTMGGPKAVEVSTNVQITTPLLRPGSSQAKSPTNPGTTAANGKHLPGTWSPAFYNPYQLEHDIWERLTVNLDAEATEALDFVTDGGARNLTAAICIAFKVLAEKRGPK